MASEVTLLEKHCPIAVVANDAGGAEVLSAYVKQNPAHFLFCMGGPAVEIFRKKIGDYLNLPLEDVITQSGVLLSGSGWQTDLELRAIRLARSLGKRSICWLDHWVNYRNRFERNGVITLPDELWVGDDYAMEISRKELPELPVFLVGNPYYKEVLEEFGRTSPSRPGIPGKICLLYLCEPIGDHAFARYGNRYHWGYTEVEAIRYFIANLAAFGENIGRILIRPHPSEGAEKYRKILASCRAPVHFSEGTQLLADLASSDCVVGSNSMAMVIAQLVGKRVVSCIPPGGSICTLPHDNIERLTEILAAAGVVVDEMRLAVPRTHR